MKHTLLDEFTSLVEKYERNLDPCHDEDSLRAVDDMAEWVKDNIDALDCDCIEDVFDEYEEMLLYMNGGYEDDFYPDGNDEDEDCYGINEGDGGEVDEEIQCPRCRSVISEADVEYVETLNENEREERYAQGMLVAEGRKRCWRRNADGLPSGTARVCPVRTGVLSRGRSRAGGSSSGRNT